LRPPCPSLHHAGMEHHPANLPTDPTCTDPMVVNSVA
jgi:hypothetical protein